MTSLLASSLVGFLEGRRATGILKKELTPLTSNLRTLMVKRGSSVPIVLTEDIERFEIKPYFAVKNFTHQLYIASRAPQGIQPGLFRQTIAGIRFSF